MKFLLMLHNNPAALEAAHARQSRNAAAERRAHLRESDLRGELAELHRQAKAIARRFPTLSPREKD